MIRRCIDTFWAFLQTLLIISVPAFATVVLVLAAIKMSTNFNILEALGWLAYAFVMYILLSHYKEKIVYYMARPWDKLYNKYGVNNEK